MTDTTHETKTKTKRMKQRVFVDWADGYRGPGWYTTGTMFIPVDDDEDARDDDEPIVEVVYGSLI